MPESVSPVDLRKSPRARLRLPARIRWLGPLGMRLEITETIDVSRDGLLVRRSEPCVPRARVWVAYPFDPSAAAIQPETPARVARVHGGAKGGFYVGLELQLPTRELVRSAENEHRRTARFSFSLPIFVRPSGSQWPEESMTQNVSNSGVRFETTQTYKVGEMVRAKIPWGEWAKTGEILGRVVRVEGPAEAPDEMGNGAPRQSTVNLPLMSVAVEWMNTSRNGDTDAAKLSRIGSA